MKIVKILLVVVLSVGWIVPAYAAASSYLQHLNVEVSSLLRGVEPMISLPFLAEVGQMVLLSLVWLAAAITYWSFVEVSRIIIARKSE